MSSERSPGTAPPAGPAAPLRPPAGPGPALTRARPPIGQPPAETKQARTQTSQATAETKQARTQTSQATAETGRARIPTGHMAAEPGRTLSIRNAMPVLAIAALLEAGALASPATRPFDHVLVLAGSLALGVCRRAPLVALAVATGCMLLYSVRADPGPVGAFPVMIAVFAAVATGHRTAAATAAVAFLGGGLATDLATDLATASGRATQPVVEGTVLLLGWFMAAAVAGIAARNWRAYLQQVEQRAADAERTREETALRRAGEERLRIARELHDSLTHSISIIKVQAGVAVHLARKRGEEVPQALLAIQEASGEAMRELRATLEVLRQDADDPPGSGLNLLDDLVKRARDAGLPATVTIDGDRRPLPAEVDRTAYRIVQEALTNVARHAGPASASVRVAYCDDGLLVQVDDDGRASPGTQPVPGVGLLGMRERVSALGGRLEAAPRPGGGFTVRADLPLPSAAQPPSRPGPAQPAPIPLVPRPSTPDQHATDREILDHHVADREVLDHHDTDRESPDHHDTGRDITDRMVPAPHVTGRTGKGSSAPKASFEETA